ncbi:MAG TPA: methylenetetrahydrofolate reductase [NAD(P)H] [Candidatus Hydrogenedentes bacterium]|nr:methylenetetrahydrofolate reductase [NAD(P)H] [Candidatus Hydrogenedentota bacterium]HOS02886.1 methylenetetrahydrofolate reductase [NAD(P)H] [Candidatus Hydrogenedentota bacterium]
MPLVSAYSPGKLGLSFELYPPRDAAGMDDLFANLTELIQFRPSFVTCTYGAGGSTRDKTLDIAARVRREFGLPVAAHLTCVGATPSDLRAYLDDAAARGIEGIVALRGDPPKGEAAFRATDGGFRHADELVRFIRSEHPGFSVVVADYPEKHLEAPDFETDLDHLKRKVDAGADFVISQLFYRNDDFFRFRDRCAATGIRVPIVPGILPVTSLKQIKRISAMCGATLPDEFLTRLEFQAGDPKGQFDVGVYFATRQVEGLVEAGCPGIHFYVLNKSQATATIMRALTLFPRDE